MKNNTFNNYKNDILNFIVENDLHSRFTISIIKKLSTTGIKKKDGTISFAFSDVYLDIVNSGYTDPIIDDLKQEVFLELINLVNDECVYIGEDENEKSCLIFEDYINDNGKEKSYYLNLYHVVRNYMNNQKKHIDRSAICIDLYDENNEEVTVSTKNKDYKRLLASSLSDNSLENVAGRKDIQLIFGYLKVKYPKHISLMCKVFELLYIGYTYDEIAKALNITKNKVRYQISLMRSVFDDTTLEIKYDRNYYASLFSDTTRNKCTTTYINKEVRKDVTATIKKDTISKNTYNSIPLSCGILDDMTKEKINKIVADRLEETMKNSVSFTNIYDRKKQCINVVNNNGTTLFVIDGKLSEKTIKKYKIATI